MQTMCGGQNNLRKIRVAIKMKRESCHLIISKHVGEIMRTFTLIISHDPLSRFIQRLKIQITPLLSAQCAVGTAHHTTGTRHTVVGYSVRYSDFTYAKHILPYIQFKCYFYQLQFLFLFLALFFCTSLGLNGK